MTRSLALITALLGTLLSSSANAGRASLEGGRAQVPVEIVTIMVSREGEDHEEFLRRAGGLMAAYTDRSEFESCARVCTSGARTGLFITTSKAHAHCGLSDRCPGGFTPTEDSIHSHPQVSSYTVNEVDAAFSGFRDKRGTRKHARPEAFSTYDYASGPGYLATGGQLIHQRGRKTDRVVGELTAAPDDVLASILAPAQVAVNEVSP